MDRSREHTAAFTGHRRYDGECDDALRAVVRELYGRGFRVFWSGMALGFDLAAAEAVLALRGNCPDCGSAAPFLSPGRRIVFPRRIASDICGFSIGRTRWRRSLRVMNRVVTCAATSLWWSGRPPSWHGSTAAREGRAIPGIMRGAARRSGSTCGATVNRNFSEALRPLFCGYRVNFGTDRPKCLNSFRLRLRYSRPA